MAATNPAKHLVKRYANRKLYDSTLRRFTTLDELAQLVESGIRVVVKDHDSGEDRTEEVLVQALGRRMRGTPGGSDLLAGLLRKPAKVALELADEIKPPSQDEDQDGADTAKPGPQKSKGKKKGKKKKSAPAEDARDRELEDLRTQVNELTQAVAVLLQERVADHEAQARES